MFGIQHIEEPRATSLQQTLQDAFADIAQKARLGGDADVLMKLDRIPGLLLGPTNRVSEGAVEASVADAYAVLQNIAQTLAQRTAS